VKERDLSRVVALKVKILAGGNPHEVVVVRPGIESKWGFTMRVGKNVERMPEVATTLIWMSRSSHPVGNDLSSMTRATKPFTIAVGVPGWILIVLLFLVVAESARRTIEVASELFVRVREAVHIVEERGRGVLERRAAQGWSTAVVARLKGGASSTCEGEQGLANALLLFQLKLLIMSSSSLRVRATGNSATTLAGALMVDGTGTGTGASTGCVGGLRVRGCLVVGVTPAVGIRGYSGS